MIDKFEQLLKLVEQYNESLTPEEKEKILEQRRDHMRRRLLEMSRQSRKHTPNAEWYERSYNV